MKFFTCTIAFLLFIFSLAGKLHAQTAPVLSFTPVLTSGLLSPVDVVNAGDSSKRLFIVQQGGAVKIFMNDALLPTNFLNIADSILAGGERGLLSIAFHPKYTTNRYFYVYYNNKAGNITISRMQTKADDPNQADPTSLVVLLSIPKPFSNHNGGRLLFGPDGNLYFGTGDGGSGGDPYNNSQSNNSLLGKMIRINVDNFDTAPYYTIPADNPYANSDTVKHEIFYRGLRNPFRWSFDKLNNDFWIADVGQNQWEEVDRQPFLIKALNFGWRCYEGAHAYNTTGCGPAENYIKPVFDYGHNSTTGGYSITGGCVYRGTKYPALYGYYMCADYVSGHSWLIAPSGGGNYAATIQAGVLGSIVAFGQAEDDEVYALTLNGKLYSVGTTTIVPVVLQSFTAKPYLGFNELNWQIVAGASVTTTQVLYSFDGVDFQPAGNAVAGSQQTFIHIIDGYTTIYYRLKFTLTDGQVIYSTIIKVGKGDLSVVKLYPTIVNNSQLKLETTKPVQRLVLVSMDGKKVFEKSFTNFLGNTTINLPPLSNGIYIAQLYLGGKPLNYKIFIKN